MALDSEQFPSGSYLSSGQGPGISEGGRGCCLPAKEKLRRVLPAVDDALNEMTRHCETENWEQAVLYACLAVGRLQYILDTMNHLADSGPDVITPVEKPESVRNAEERLRQLLELDDPTGDDFAGTVTPGSDEATPVPGRTG